MGHVKDLPKKKMGIDIEHDFTPESVVIDGKKKVLDEITTAAKHATRVLLAPDPDREGEAIAWHLKEALGLDDKDIRRVTFNEITKKAVQAAFANPGTIDMDRVAAQEARRILDRVVGYRLSPLLRRKVRRVLAGSGALRGGHDYSVLTNILETFPRDELFQIGDLDLLTVSEGVLHLLDRPRPKAFVRRDRFNRKAARRLAAHPCVIHGRIGGLDVAPESI